MADLLVAVVTFGVVAVVVFLIAVGVSIDNWKRVWSWIQRPAWHAAAILAIACGALVGISTYTLRGNPSFWEGFWANAISSLITGAVVSISLGWYVSKRVADYQGAMQRHSDHHAATYDVIALKNSVRDLMVAKPGYHYEPKRFLPAYIEPVVTLAQGRRLLELASMLPEETAFIGLLSQLPKANAEFVHIAKICDDTLHVFVQNAREKRDNRIRAQQEQQAGPFGLTSSAYLLNLSLPGAAERGESDAIAYILAYELNSKDVESALKMLNGSSVPGDILYRTEKDAYWMKYYRAGTDAQGIVMRLVTARSEVMAICDQLREIVSSS